MFCTFQTYSWIATNTCHPGVDIYCSPGLSWFLFGFWLISANKFKMCFQPPINLSCELLEIPAIFPVLPKTCEKPVKKREIDYQLCFQKGQGQRKKLFLKLQLTVDLFKDSYRYGRNTPKLIFEA